MFISKNQIIFLCRRDENLSAGNQISIIKEKVGTSETIRTLTKRPSEWLAGIIDGGGFFEFDKLEDKYVLLSIKIFVILRDVKILHQVKKLVKGGIVKKHTKKTMCYIASNKNHLVFILNTINRHIRIKSVDFKKACSFFNIHYLHSDYNLGKNSNYLSALVDIKGSFVFNYPNNRIDLFIELKQNEYTLKLNFNNVISGVIPKVYKFKKRNSTRKKIYYSIRFSFSGISNMLNIYNYFKYHLLYSDFKYFRVMQYKQFLTVRILKDARPNTKEFKMYNKFLRRFFKYKNNDQPLPKYIK